MDRPSCRLRIRGRENLTNPAHARTFPEMKKLAIGLSLLCFWLCFTGCSKPATPAGTVQVAIADPVEAFRTYIEYVRKADYDSAVGLIYVADPENLEFFKSGWAPLTRRIQEESWEVSVLARVDKGKFAGLIWTSTPARDDPSPVLAINDDGAWKIHHTSISGRLGDIFKEEDLLTVQQVVRTSYDKINEIKAKRAQATEANPKP